MEIGESVAVGLENNVKCPINHTDAATIASQPAITVKNVETLKSNLASGTSTILFGVDDSGKVFDKGPQILVDPEPSPALAIQAKDPLPIKLGEQSLPLSVAAHHIIPGKDSLPKSKLAEYVWKSKGKISSDIGYHVDGAENGVWLPTHQALSAGMGKAATINVPSGADPTQLVHIGYRKLSQMALDSGPAGFVLAYAQVAMELIGAQFHDAHKEYSQKIVEMLEAIHAWLQKASGENCEECKKCKSPDGKLPPPHYLAYRLNALARQVRGWLVGRPSGWKDPFFTSDYARQYKKIEAEYEAYLSQRGRN